VVLDVVAEEAGDSGEQEEIRSSMGGTLATPPA